MISKTDITPFMSWFFERVFILFRWFYNTLDSITFFGTSLLSFTIYITLIATIIGIVMNLVVAKNIAETHREIKAKNKKSEGDEKNANSK